MTRVDINVALWDLESLFLFSSEQKDFSEEKGQEWLHRLKTAIEVNGETAGKNAALIMSEAQQLLELFAALKACRYRTVLFGFSWLRPVLAPISIEHDQQQQPQQKRQPHTQQRQEEVQLQRRESMQQARIESTVHSNINYEQPDAASTPAAAATVTALLRDSTGRCNSSLLSAIEQNITRSCTMFIIGNDNAFARTEHQRNAMGTIYDAATSTTQEKTAEISTSVESAAAVAAAADQLREQIKEKTLHQALRARGVLLASVAAAQVFVQANWTGPPLRAWKPSEILEQRRRHEFGVQSSKAQRSSCATSREDTSSGNNCRNDTLASDSTLCSLSRADGKSSQNSATESSCESSSSSNTSDKVVCSSSVRSEREVHKELPPRTFGSCSMIGRETTTERNVFPPASNCPNCCSFCKACSTCSDSGSSGTFPTCYCETRLEDVCILGPADMQRRDAAAAAVSSGSSSSDITRGDLLRRLHDEIMESFNADGEVVYELVRGLPYFWLSCVLCNILIKLFHGPAAVVQKHQEKQSQQDPLHVQPYYEQHQPLQQDCVFTDNMRVIRGTEKAAPIETLTTAAAEEKTLYKVTESLHVSVQPFSLFLWKARIAFITQRILRQVSAAKVCPPPSLLKVAVENYAVALKQLQLLPVGFQTQEKTLDWHVLAEALNYSSASGLISDSSSNTSEKAAATTAAVEGSESLFHMLPQFRGSAVSAKAATLAEAAVMSSTSEEPRAAAAERSASTAIAARSAEAIQCIATSSGAVEEMKTLLLPRPEWLTSVEKSEMLHELALRLSTYGRRERFEQAWELACAAYGVQFEFTGVEGMRRKHQLQPVAQLMVAVTRFGYAAAVATACKATGDGAVGSCEEKSNSSANAFAVAETAKAHATAVGSAEFPAAVEPTNRLTPTNSTVKTVDAQIEEKTLCEKEARNVFSVNSDTLAPETRREWRLKDIYDETDVFERPQLCERTSLSIREAVEASLSHMEQALLLAKGNELSENHPSADELAYEQLNAIASRCLLVPNDEDFLEQQQRKIRQPNLQRRMLPNEENQVFQKKEGKKEVFDVERDSSSTDNWLLRSLALWLRCRAEYHRSKTIERATLQLQALVDSVEDRLPSAGRRLAYFFAVTYPTWWEGRKALAMRMLRVGARLTALESFKALELWEEVASCLLAADRRAEAEELLLERLKIKETPALWCTLGDVTNDRTCYEKAWTLSKHRYARAQISLGRLHFQQNALEKAVKNFTAALDINPLNKSCWFIKGCCCMRLQQPQDALQAFARVVALDPEDGDAWGNMAAVHSQRETWSAARVCIREAIKYKRENWRMWDTYLKISVRLRDIRAINEALRQYVSLNAKEHIPLWIYAFLEHALLENDGDREEAQKKERENETLKEENQKEEKGEQERKNQRTARNGELLERKEALTKLHEKADTSLKSLLHSSPQQTTSCGNDRQIWQQRKNEKEFQQEKPEERLQQDAAMQQQQGEGVQQQAKQIYLFQTTADTLRYLAQHIADQPELWRVLAEFQIKEKNFKDAVETRLKEFRSLAAIIHRQEINKRLEAALEPQSLYLQRQQIQALHSSVVLSKAVVECEFASPEQRRKIIQETRNQLVNVETTAFDLEGRLQTQLSGEGDQQQKDQLSEQHIAVEGLIKDCKEALQRLYID